MNRENDNEEFNDFIMKIYIDLLRSIAEKNVNFLPLSEDLSKTIMQLWNTLAGNSFF